MAAHITNESKQTKVLHKLALRKKPRGLVIDDNPYPLVNSIEDWITAKIGTAWKPDWSVHKSSRHASEIDKWIEGIDFLLLDNRLEGKFEGFRAGLDIGQHVVERKETLPVFFYTAFPRDLMAPGEANTYREEFNKFVDRPNVHYYLKSDLEPDKLLNELCYQIAIGPDPLGETSSVEETKELQTLLDAQVQKVNQYRYRVIDFDRRKAHQTLLCLSDINMGEIEIPTHHLNKVGLKGRNTDVQLKIVQFDGGQILSYIAAAPFKAEVLSDEVMKILRDEKE